MSDPQFEPLHPNARWLLRLGSFFGLLWPYAFGSGWLLIGWLEMRPWQDPLGAVLFAAGLSVPLALGWLYGSAAFRRTHFALDDNGLRVRRGVFWRTETLVPRSRVQHTDVHRGPLDRRLGLAGLKVYTAGTRLASVSLDGLPVARAVQLRDALIGHDDDAV